MNVWLALLGLIVIAVIGGMINVIGEDSEVKALAAQAACGNLFCGKGGQEAVHRSPLDYRVEFTLPNEGGTVAVKCTRMVVFVGPWTCEKESP